VILAELVPFDDPTAKLTKPTLAMIGGFSAVAVYHVLNRLVETVEALVRGGADERIKSQELASRIRYDRQLAQGRTKLAADLVRLQAQLGDDADPAAIASKLNQIIDSILPSDLATPTVAALPEPAQAQDKPPPG